MEHIRNSLCSLSPQYAQCVCGHLCPWPMERPARDLRESNGQAQPAQNGARAWRDLSCTVLGCRSCPSVLMPSNNLLNAHRSFDLSKGFTVHSFWWLDFISFLSAQCAGCLLHPLLVHQAGILEELCVVLASHWSTLAPGEIEVWKKKCVCGVGLIFLDTKNVWKNEVRQRNAWKATHHLNSQKSNG